MPSVLRIHGLSHMMIERAVVEGDIDEILEALQVAENAEKMKAGAEME